MVIERCINCGVIPVIVPQKGYYAFILKHPKTSICYSTFKLESHQHTEKLCVDAWNEFNRLNNKRAKK